ncbi:MAG: AbrB/MazE/SpoVT family DNA-binding domain-containing protein [Armatimonadetes bacterium]|nr:AbrB/MazE/SpoVT family DNA-binding domain-containing protein [Armatimonadota bacterium]
MTTAAVKITRKGQVTIPKEIREKLKTDVVYFEVEDDTVIVKPVGDVAGCLEKYAANIKQGVSLRLVKEKAWEVAVGEKTGKKSS